MENFRISSFAAVITVSLFLLISAANAADSDEAVIEDVDKQGLDKLVEGNEFVAALFYAPGDKDCEQVLKKLENIDDKLDGYEIPFVKVSDPKLAKLYRIAFLPALVYFRHKHPTIYQGDLRAEAKVLEWLTTMQGIEVADEVEEVNLHLLDRLIQAGGNIAVLYYKKGDKKSEATVQELENIDDEADNLDIDFVKVSDPAAHAVEDFADDLPKLVYYRHEIPIMYEGDLMEEEKVLQWLTASKVDGDVIENVGANMLDDLIEEKKNVVILFTLPKHDKSEKVLKELENIDDDTDKHDIKFVKSEDKELAASYGIDDFPALIYFENNMPNIYEGDLMDEDAVLAWILDQQRKETIENINLEILEKILDEEEYVALFLYSDNCKSCDAALAELENIDDECWDAGIYFVKSHDKDVAKKYGVSSFPKLIYIRNKAPLAYTGDLLDEEKLLAWLTSEEAMDNPDKIDDINRKVLQLMLKESNYVACFFYTKKNCAECDPILQELENIDDDSENLDIDFVKIEDNKLLKEYGGKQAPALIYFQKGIPTLYGGNLKDEDDLLAWLIAQKGKSPKHSEL